MSQWRGYPDSTPAAIEGVPFTAGEFKALAPAFERTKQLPGKGCDFHGKGGDPPVWNYPWTDQWRMWDRWARTCC
jgi:hypothetical protein